MDNNEVIRRIISEDLDSLVARVVFTQVVLQNDKNLKRIKGIDNDSSKCENLVDDMELLDFIQEYITGLEHNVTSDGLFKKSSFQTLLVHVKRELKIEKDKLASLIQAGLTGLRVMNKDIYSKISKDINMAYGDIVRLLYPKGIPAYLQNQDKEKIVRSNLPLDTNSFRIQSGSEYRVVDKTYEDNDGKLQNEYSNHSIVDACLEVHRKETEKSLKKESSNFNKAIDDSDIEFYYKSSLAHELKSFNESVYPAITDKDIVIIKPKLEKKASISKTIYKFEKVKDLIESKMHDEKKAVLIAKLDKEISVLKAQLINIQNEINRYKDELAVRKTPEQKHEESVQRLHEKQVKKEVEEMIEAHVRDNNSLNDNGQQNKEPKKEEAKEEQTVVVEENVNKLSDEYKQYAAIRDKLDNIKEEIKQRNGGFDQAKYEQEVVRQLHKLGNSYTEIMDEVVEMHNCVDAMKDIKELLDSAKLELEHNEEKMHTQSNTGFTALESLFRLKLMEKQKDKNIPADLKKEIEYYLDRYDKVETASKGYPEGSKERKNLANFMKQDYFSNTILIDEMNKREESRYMER